MKATDKQKQYMKEYSKRPEVAERRKKYMQEFWKNRTFESRQKRKEYDKMRYVRDKDKILKRNKNWMDKNKEKFRQYLGEYFSNSNNREKQRETSKRWYYSLDKKTYQSMKRKYENNKRKTDLNFRIGFAR